MIAKYVTINRLLRAIVERCNDALRRDTDDNTVVFIADYIQRDVRDLLQVWPADLNNAYLKRIGQSISQNKGRQEVFREIMRELIPSVEDQVDNYFTSRPSGDLASVLVDILHPVVFNSSYVHFTAGRFRDAVFNAMVAVFDSLRARTGISKDGAQLVSDALSLDNPMLIISTLSTESGKSEQKGFMQILQGAYLGVRNPQAHTLNSDFERVEAAQYLVFASLLAAKIDAAQIPEQPS